MDEESALPNPDGVSIRDGTRGNDDFVLGEGDDRVLFGAGAPRDAAAVLKAGDDLVVTLDGRPDSVRIPDHFAPGNISEVEIFVFADGTSIPAPDVKERLSITGGGRGDDVIVGFDDRETVLDGRKGDDRLFGGRFADTCLFGAGDGLDVIAEVLNEDMAEGAEDRIVFGAPLSREELTVGRDGGDLVRSVFWRSAARSTASTGG